MNSSLVLPVDVYYNWSDVRETILWTASMDTVFKANWSPNLVFNTDCIIISYYTSMTSHDYCLMTDTMSSFDFTEL